MKAWLGAFAIGLVFALGLGLSGMTHPSKVIAFLDVGGAWDPSLAFVMGGAFGVHALIRRVLLKRSQPMLGGVFQQPPSGALDRKLLAGAALFGVGWGLSGYCPGPAFVSLGAANGTVLLFVGSMLGGMVLYRALSRRAPELALPDGCSPGPEARAAK